jgi:hypothetical protein
MAGAITALLRFQRCSDRGRSVESPLAVGYLGLADVDPIGAPR